MDFTDRLRLAQAETHSAVCVGLDPDPARLPEPLRDLPVDEAVRRFCFEIIEATHDFACAYKPNTAFFESLGSPGLRVLEDVVGRIPSFRISIVDGKRGDIGNSARMYARFFFEHLGCDACTVSPYMGRDAVVPFLETPGRAAFVLARTSNPGASDIQELTAEGAPVYEHVARRFSEWGAGFPGTLGAVVGATDARALDRLRGLLPGVPFLVPGVGAQGGSERDAMAVAREDAPVIVNSSRKILYASAGADYADAARAETRRLRDALREAA